METLLTPTAGVPPPPGPVASPSLRFGSETRTEGTGTYSLPVVSGLMGSKEVEGLGRTELLSSEADDCSGWVSNPAEVDALLRGSKSPSLFDSAAAWPHSGKSHRYTKECHHPQQAAAAQTQPLLQREGSLLSPSKSSQFGCRGE